MRRRYILLLSALVLFTGAVIMTGCPSQVKPQTPKYKVTLNSGKHGSVTVKPSLPADDMVEAHTRLSFTAQPNEGYEVEWTGAAPDNADKNKATLTVTANAVVTATFKKPGNSAEVQNYHVALSSGNNGTLIADTPLPADGMVAAGSTLTFTATPDFDYEVERWTGAVPDPSDSTKATLTVTEHTTVSVTFKAKQADVALLEIDSTGKVIKGSPELDGYLILPDTVN